MKIKDPLWKMTAAGFSLFLLSMSYLTVPIVKTLKSTAMFEPVMQVFYVLFVVVTIYFIFRAAVQRLTAAQWLVVTMILMAYLVLILTTPYAVERIHVLFYSVHGVIYLKALPGRFSGLRRSVLAALITAAVGAADEGLQIFIPHRYASLSDVMLNAVSGMLGLVFASKVQAWKLKLP